jgi:hypothetical protein
MGILPMKNQQPNPSESFVSISQASVSEIHPVPVPSRLHFKIPKGYPHHAYENEKIKTNIKWPHSNYPNSAMTPPVTVTITPLALAPVRQSLPNPK